MRVSPALLEGLQLLLEFEVLQLLEFGVGEGGVGRGDRAIGERDIATGLEAAQLLLDAGVGQRGEHLPDGVVGREQAYLGAGGSLLFPLPRIESVAGAQELGRAA